MAKSKKELENRIKEFESLIKQYESVISEKDSWIKYLESQVHIKLDTLINAIPPVVCDHDWNYAYNTTCPNRTCKKCFKYEMINNFMGTFNSTNGSINFLNNVTN